MWCKSAVVKRFRPATNPYCPIMHAPSNHLETAIDRLVLVGNVDAGNIVLQLFSTFQREVNEYQIVPIYSAHLCTISMWVRLYVHVCVCVCANKTWIERTT